SRSRRYLEIKKRMTRVRKWKTKEWMPAPKPPMPLQWTGDLNKTIQEIVGNPSAHIKATSTTNRQRVKVPIRLPHPMRRVNAAEIVRLIKSEYDELMKRAVKVLKKRVREFRVPRTRKVA